MTKKEGFQKKLEELEQQIQVLATQMDKVEDEKLQMENQLKRALADYANLQRDSEKRVLLRMNQLKISTARNLMPLMDDISFALEASSSLKLEGDAKAWLEGLMGTLKDIEKSIESLGAEKIEVKVGDKYDSTLHEAISVVQEGKKDTVHQVLQPGFILGELVVRPARVIVAKGK